MYLTNEKQVVSIVWRSPLQTNIQRENRLCRREATLTEESVASASYILCSKSGELEERDDLPTI
jgi:hypothetical protein